MALKFLNKKGWHTGSLRNIENVWKAEQKHDAEQKKLEELRKQIHEERERSEFRQIQEAAGLVPRQERLDFLYESRLAVGKGSSEGFKALQDQPSGGAAPPVAAESSSSKAVVPGALFEDKLQSANDAWRKLHTDPLLLIRQKEQEALARIKNNPIRMAMIRNSVESKKREEDKKEHINKRNKHKLDQRKSPKDEDSFKSQSDLERGRRGGKYEGKGDDKEDRRNDKKGDIRKGNNEAEWYEKDNKQQEKHLSTRQSKHLSVYKESRDIDLNSDRRSGHGNYSSRDHSGDKHADPCQQRERRNGENRSTSDEKYSSKEIYHRSDYNRRRGVPQMSEEEREARLREMQMDAELHEGQRWKRLKKAAEADVLEANQATYSRGKSFLDATQKSVYGMENGGSATIEESVRRRAYYSQGQSEHERNAFRR
ncbi:hypothetical protein KSP39_PZI012761 [Platanthera zijinensis]|uniref:CBF1-interacting co-repressor CIR N-terminal domain-containing protein n=1 Tax=Platanthera zijinensis TaxID=2320716 RepID=A0AAP0BEV3_9ASPA